MGKQIKERRRTGNHRRGQNRPEMPAAMAESSDEIHHPWFVSSGEMKGRKGRTSCAIYSQPSVEEGLGFLARGARSMARRKTYSGGAPAQGGR
jgi:hypothetical protein